MGDLRKTSAQRLKGEQSEALRQLADDLMAYCETAGQAGVEAGSLTDGLEKIAGGQLAPEVLQVMMHQRPEPGDQTDRSHGFLMRVLGPDATVQRWTSGEGYASGVSLELDANDVRSLARSLAQAQPEQLPINLYADRITDVRIKVLNHEAAIQARRFAGKTAATHGEQQRLFDQLAEALSGISRRVLIEGASPDDER